MIVKYIQEITQINSLFFSFWYVCLQSSLMQNLLISISHPVYQEGYTSVKQKLHYGEEEKNLNSDLMFMCHMPQADFFIFHLYLMFIYFI